MNQVIEGFRVSTLVDISALVDSQGDSDGWSEIVTGPSKGSSGKEEIKLRQQLSTKSKEVYDSQQS